MLNNEIGDNYIYFNYRVDHTIILHIIIITRLIIMSNKTSLTSYYTVTPIK